MATLSVVFHAGVSQEAPIAVLYDQGAVSPTQILESIGSADSLVVVLGPSDHAQRMRPLFVEACAAVHNLTEPNVVHHLRRHRLAGMVTFSEPMLIPASELSTVLGLRHHDAAVVQRLTDKRVQRKALRSANVDATASVLVSTPSQGKSALLTVGLPAVAKPVRGVNSRNVVLVDDLMSGEAEIKRLLDEEGPVLVEEYLRGADVPEPFGSYVSIETVVQDGDRCHLAVTGKLRFAPPFRETGQFWPALLDVSTESSVLSLTDSAVAALGVTTGVLHTEIKLTPDGPRIIEVNGRMGGYIADLALRAAGVDLVDVAAKTACGQRQDLDPIRPDRVFFQFTTPAPVEAGTVAAAFNGRELRAIPGVTGYQALVRPGTAVGGVGTLDLNLITGDVPDHQALAGVVETIMDTVSYEFESATGRVRRTARELAYGTVENEQGPLYAESLR